MRLHFDAHGSEVPEGNVWTVTAIANYTERVADPSLSPDAHEEALKFLGKSIGYLGRAIWADTYVISPCMRLE